MLTARLTRVSASRGLANSLASHARASARPSGRLLSSARTVDPATAVAILVDVEIEPSRIDEFLTVMEGDALGSREEAGCLRFDLIRASDTRFFFYEVYADADAVAVHKAQPHFQPWADFKESGGVLKQTSTKAGFPAAWAFE